MLFSFFYHQKTIKKKEGLHEVIWALSLSIISVEFSFKPVYPTMFVKIWNSRKIMKHLWNISGICTCKSKYWLLIFYSYASITHHSPYHPWSQKYPLGSIITPQVKMTWNVRLFIFYMNCKVMTLQFFKSSIYHIAR